MGRMTQMPDIARQSVPAGFERGAARTQLLELGAEPAVGVEAIPAIDGVVAEVAGRRQGADQQRGAGKARSFSSVATRQGSGPSTRSFSEKPTIAVGI